MKHLRRTYNKTLESKAIGILLLVLCIVAYTVAYFGRVSYSVALTELSAVIPVKIVGTIGTLYFISYAVGQIINGFIADKVSPFLFLPIGLSVSAGCNIAMAYLSSAPLMLVVWGINGFAQAMLWSPILIIISRVIAPKLKHKALLFISVSGPTGTLLCYLVGGLLIPFGHSAVFLFAGGLLACTVLLCAAFFLSILKKLSVPQDLPPAPEPATAPKPSLAPATEKGRVKQIYMLSGLFLIVAVIAQGMLKDGLTSWVPTLIMERFSLTSSASSFLTMFLPVINLSGSFIATYFYRKANRRHEFLLCSFFMLAAVISIAPMFIDANEFLFIFLLSLSTTAMCGFNQITIALIPQRFQASGKVAFVSGTLNALTYLGSAAAAFLIGFISDSQTFSAVILFLLIVAAAGFLASLLSHLIDV